MANILTNTGASNQIVGSENNDTIVDREGFLTGTTDVINALGGNDVVFGDHDFVFSDSSTGNNSIAAATNIDTAQAWSTKPNPDIGDVSVPYTTVLGEGAGEFDFFAVIVGAGETITLDIDYGENDLGGVAFDSFLVLFDAAGNELDQNDDTLDADVPLEGRGSVDGISTTDSYLYSHD